MVFFPSEPKISIRDIRQYVLTTVRSIRRVRSPLRISLAPKYHMPTDFLHTLSDYIWYTFTHHTPGSG